LTSPPPPPAAAAASSHQLLLLLLAQGQIGRMDGFYGTPETQGRHPSSLYDLFVVIFKQSNKNNNN
jgi:hypothetical protein